MVFFVQLIFVVNETMNDTVQQASLIAKAKKGDEQAFEALVFSCQNKAYAIAFRYMKNEADTLDVLQESFVKMYTKLETFSYKSTFETWFFRIVINSCYDALRKTKSQFIKTEIAGEAEMLSDSENNQSSTEAVVLKAEQSQIVLNALESLPQPQRDVLILREYNYFSYSEISQILQISEGTVKSRLNRAKLNLRDILMEQNPNFFV